MCNRKMPALASYALLTMAAIFIALPAAAESLRVSTSGVFTPEMPSLPFSAPGATWSMSFLVDRQPVPIGVGTLTEVSAYVTVPFSDFKLFLDGVEVAPAQLVSFYAGANDGGMEVFFSPVAPGVTNYQSIGTVGAAYYSGSELAPTIEPGTYSAGAFGIGGLYVVDFDVKYWQPATEVTISAVPEPSTWALTAAGAALLLGWRRGVQRV
jgi:hypothetical protein